ncbi:MAG: anthrone oxygenase family protein, partial [Pseudomonadota bacterium]
VYLIGCFGVTVFCNVPMNEALAGMDVSNEATRDYWLKTYVPRWTFWNSVRTIACAVAAASLLLGSLWLTQDQIRTA